jgi:hypothetical protein
MRYVNLYPTQPLVPQCLASCDDCFKGGGTDLGLRICARLCLRDEGDTDANGHLRGAPRKREERPSLDRTFDETDLEVEARFTETLRDEAVSSKRGSEGVMRRVGHTDRSPVQTPN